MVLTTKVQGRCSRSFLLCIIALVLSGAPSGASVAAAQDGRSSGGGQGSSRPWAS
jgi:hypothetical protein